MHASSVEDAIAFRRRRGRAGKKCERESEKDLRKRLAMT